MGLIHSYKTDVFGKLLNLGGPIMEKVGFLQSQAGIAFGGWNPDGSRCSRKLDINVKKLDVSDC